MLPITTYNIPEPATGKIQADTQWICIILEKPLTAPDEELLRKICSALKADFINDVLLINLAENESFSVIDFNQTNIKLMLSFGVLPSRLGIWIDIPSPDIRFLESYTFILTKPLAELANNPATKKQLWSGMQLFMENKS
ncbi:MAG TPA: hypothetical protein VMZ69_09075 [Saprospiraceae bacterium]|nr:hypothetical protein [Saprospiraceae bacterium]